MNLLKDVLAICSDKQTVRICGASITCALEGNAGDMKTFLKGGLLEWPVKLIEVKKIGAITIVLEDL